jgi:hypothetical protein
MLAGLPLWVLQIRPGPDTMLKLMLLEAAGTFSVSA